MRIIFPLLNAISVKPRVILRPNVLKENLAALALIADQKTILQGIVPPKEMTIAEDTNEIVMEMMTRAEVKEIIDLVVEAEAEEVSEVVVVEIVVDSEEDAVVIVVGSEEVVEGEVITGMNLMIRFRPLKM